MLLLALHTRASRGENSQEQKGRYTLPSLTQIGLCLEMYYIAYIKYIFKKNLVMFNNIAFVGGIHGVGKSTICHKICADLNINYLSASDVLQWKVIKPNYRDKKVNDIPFTQNKLITGLANIIKDDQFYLLDGHYCLLDKNNKIYNIDIETFQQINPTSFNVIIGDIAEIKLRLEGRDELKYDFSLLDEMQKNELKYAIHLSETLNRPIKFGSQNDYNEILNSIKMNLTNNSK
ncbi:MAG: ATP-binding protein [Mucilaginibacter sp.]